MLINAVCCHLVFRVTLRIALVPLYLQQIKTFNCNNNQEQPPPISTLVSELQCHNMTEKNKKEKFKSKWRSFTRQSCVLNMFHLRLTEHFSCEYLHVAPWITIPHADTWKHFLMWRQQKNIICQSLSKTVTNHCWRINLFYDVTMMVWLG